MPLNYQMKWGQKRRNVGRGGERRTILVFWTGMMAFFVCDGLMHTFRN